MPVMIDFNESLFTEFVENTHLDDERHNSLSPQITSTNTNIEIRRRTEALIFTLLSKLSYETTDKILRRYLYNRRLISLLLRYIYLCDEPNPRAIRIINRLTKLIDCIEYLLELGLPYLIVLNFHLATDLQEYDPNISVDDKYLLNILLNDNRAFFQHLSWTSERNRLKTIEQILIKNVEASLSTPYGINEAIKRLDDSNADEKFHCVLTLVGTLKYENNRTKELKYYVHEDCFIFREHHLTSVLFQRTSGYKYLLNQSNKRTCFWALRTLFHRFNSLNNSTYVDEL